MSADHMIELSKKAFDIDLDYGNPALLAACFGAALACLVYALFGFKLLRISVVLMGAVTGYYVGAYQLPLFIGDAIKWDSQPIVLGSVCALTLAIMAVKLCKTVIFISSFFSAYTAGILLAVKLLNNLNGVSAFKNILTYVIAISYSIIVAYLICKFFKHIYIAYCSIGGMIGFIFSLMIPLEAVKSGIILDISALLFGIGLLLGILAAIRQFKRCSHISF